MTLTLNENIKRIRKERGLTQKRLGEICGIAEPNIRKYENGKQNPKLETVEKIASALGVSAFDLMGVEYFDLKNPDAGKQYTEYNSFQNYLCSLGYTVKEEPEKNQEENETCSYAIAGMVFLWFYLAKNTINFNHPREICFFHFYGKSNSIKISRHPLQRATAQHIRLSSASDSRKRRI